MLPVEIFAEDLGRKQIGELDTCMKETMVINKSSASQ